MTTQLATELELTAALQRLNLPKTPPQPAQEAVDDKDVAAYIRRLDRYLIDVQASLLRYVSGTDIVLRSLVARRLGAGPLASRPAATGSGRLWFDTGNRVLWGDLSGSDGWVALAYLNEQPGATDGNLATWTEEGELVDAGLAPNGEWPGSVPADRVPVDAAAYSGALSPADENTQLALDTLNAHNHDPRNDGRYIALIATPVVGDFVTQAAGGQLAKAGKKPADYLELAGGTMTGALGLFDLRNAGYKTGITNATNTSLWKEVLAAMTGDGGMYLVQVQVTSGVNLQSYWALVKWASGYDGTANGSSGPTVVATDQYLKSGTLTVNHLLNVATPGDITHRINVNTSLGTPTITVNWTVCHTRGTYVAL